MTSAGGASGAPTVTRTSGSILYIDASSSNPTLGAAYVTYQIANDGTARPDVWATIDGFSGTGNVVTLAAHAASTIHVGPMAANATKTVFFYLAASAATTNAQSHTIHVYDGKPGAGGTQLTSSTQSLTVSDTQQANTNKIDLVTVGSATPNLGGSFSVTVNGHTGNTTSTPMLYFSPAAAVTFLADVFQVTSTSISFNETGCPSVSKNCSTIVDSLQIPAANMPDSADTPYTAVYTFRAINTSAGTTPVSPIAYIS